MTDEEMRIKIAEACPSIRWHELQWCWYSQEIRKWIPCVGNSPLNDLNAMHEAEKVLKDEEHLRYRVNLWNVVTTEGDETTWDRHFISATARQRAFAFIKTLNLEPK